MPAFWNQITIGSSNQTFQTDDNDDGVAVATHGITAGTYTWDTLITAMLNAIQSDIATARIALSEFGHLTIDSGGAGNFRINWTDANLRDLCGYTASTLTGAASYTAPRRIGGALYLEQLTGASTKNATIKDHDPKGALTFATQTKSLGGVTRSTTSTNETDRASFEIVFLDNSARLASPSGAMATTYANAAATEPGLTMYEHARTRWRDATTVAYQGWSDGRPVRYFASTPSRALSGTWTNLSGGYSTWHFELEALKEWQAVKARPPKTFAYHVTIPATEYVAP